MAAWGHFLIPQSLFADQNISVNKLSDLDPLASLRNVTAPLDNVWRALYDQFNIKGLPDIKNFISRGKNITSPGPQKSNLEGSFSAKDTFDVILDWWQTVRSFFILVANILVAILEI